ncbi:VOC family protein [Saccharomonospora azurea]|uniref:VOC family protein n=1 Tax=Saccharomonospora azurea TaxID=40988 RepID=UPI003D8A0F94
MHTTAASPFCWLDVKTHAVADLSAVVAHTLGWHVAMVEESPRPVMSVDGYAVGGLSDLANPVYPSETPDHVAYYLAVDELDRRVDVALEHGARLVVPPFDVPGQGRMATLTDPLGAGFSLWQAEGFAGWTFPAGRNGAPCGMVLAHPDAARLRGFYDTVCDGGLTTTSFVEQWVDDVPAWEVVLGVDEPEDVVERARTHGSVRVGPGVPGVSALRLQLGEGFALHLTRS